MAAADRKITYTAAEVAELIRPLTQSVEALQKENAELKRKLEHLNEILANAQRARFGQSSEKKSYVLSEDQMSLFNEAEICQDSKAEEPTEETLTVKAHARKKKRTIDELAKNLPVEEIIIGLPESRLTCDKCGGTFKLIGRSSSAGNSSLSRSLRRFWNTTAAPMPATSVRRIPALPISLPPERRRLL